MKKLRLKQLEQIQIYKTDYPLLCVYVLVEHRIRMTRTIKNTLYDHQHIDTRGKGCTLDYSS